MSSIVAVLVAAFVAAGAALSAVPDEPAHEGQRGTISASDADLARSLELAGANRAELERFLARYDYDGGRAADVDPEKRAAARWLVANMPPHGFSRITLQTADGTAVPFEATDHRSLAEAQVRLRALKRERGPLDFRRERFVPDLTAITADQLIANHELAFRTRREEEWGRELEFGSFCEFVLPYRGSEEALDPRWRAEATELVAPILATVRERRQRDGETHGGHEDVVRAVRKAARSWVKFRQLYYLHPTDQNWTEMRASRAGRCEDETNMVVFAARAAGIVIANDFTPFWADRDNNHAWDVALDASGQGTARLAHRPAKVYRRAFGRQPTAIGSMRTEGDFFPPGLASPNLLDVTAQYVSVADVSLPIESPQPGQRVVYLCVFNGGEWRPVAGALVRDGTATFSDMGRDVLYLPAWHTDRGALAAGSPFVLDAAGDGVRRTLADVGRRGTVVLTSGRSGAGLQSAGVAVGVKGAGTYDVLAWSAEIGAWRTIASAEVTDDSSATIADVPLDCVLWVRDAAGERLERPFTVDGGTLRRW